MKNFGMLEVCDLSPDGAIAAQERLRVADGISVRDYYGHDKPFEPPFKAGDRVMINNIAGGCPPERFDLIRKPQVVEYVIPVPCNEPLWDVGIVGCPLCLTHLDIEKVKE